MRRIFPTSLLLVIAVISHAHGVRAQTPAWAWPDEWLADSAFHNTWARADAPVAMQAASRSWLWGPLPFAVANEPYAESPTGLRLVEYLDKGRMELNDPYADRSSPWFVTSGLLVKEMVSGQVQIGNSTFEPGAPAALNVAGDAFSPDAPTYASFGKHTAPALRAPLPAGAPDIVPVVPATRIDKEGNLHPIADTGSERFSNPELFGLVAYDDATGHNIPKVFADWMVQSGPILQSGRLVQGQLIDPLYVLGRPITEPYWADIRIDGQPATVLIQLYERRALTYNPNNPLGWQVEMANVGRAYYDWRYAQSPPTPAISVEASRGVLFRGYNWSPSSKVSIDISISGANYSLVGPIELTVDSAGRFAANFVPTQRLLDAISSGAYLRANAQGSGALISLPFAATDLAGRVRLSGTLAGLQTIPATGSHILTLLDFNGNASSIHLAPSIPVVYSEETPAQASVLDIGSHLFVLGTPAVDAIHATSVRIMSLSSSSASLSYQRSLDGNRLNVAGTGWPRETEISFSLDPGFTLEPEPLFEYGPTNPFASITTDSRGNLQGSVDAPDLDETTWLSAASPNYDVEVFAPLTPPSGSNQILPPQLSITSQHGAQLATIGSYCWVKLCAEIFPSHMTFPSFALPAQPGETLAFRSHYGPDPNTGLTPASFSLSIQDSSGQPVYATDRQPGRPFSCALPQSIQPGTYQMRATVTWPDPTGGTADATYGLLIEIK